MDAASNFANEDIGLT